MTTILITGANRGIGLEFVKQYAAEGADIIACCREPAKADALKAVKGKVRVMALDVGDAASVTALKKDLGDAPIDILINNAGVSGPPRKGDSIDVGGWLATFRTNSVAPVLVAEALKSNLMKSKDKKLVTITRIEGASARMVMRPMSWTARWVSEALSPKLIETSCASAAEGRRTSPAAKSAPRARRALAWLAVRDVPEEPA